MKPRRVMSDGSGERSLTRRGTDGFTMIEIMVVAGIMALILAIGIPSIYQAMKKTGMRLAVENVREACKDARAQAILRGQQVSLVIYPEEKRFETMLAEAQKQAGEDHAASASPSQSIPGLSGVIPEDVTIEELWLNGMQRTGLSQTTIGSMIRFFPNGTSDDLVLVLRSDRGERRKITLEVTTGLSSLEDVK